MSDFFDSTAAHGFVEVMVEREERLWARFRANLEAAERAMRRPRRSRSWSARPANRWSIPGFKTAARCDELALRLYKELTDGQVAAAAGIIANNGHSSSPSSSPTRTRPRLASR